MPELVLMKSLSESIGTLRIVRRLLLAGTAWDSASSSCVSSAPVPAPRQARSIGGTPSVTTSDGDLVFKVEKGNLCAA